MLHTRRSKPVVLTTLKVYALPIRKEDTHCPHKLEERCAERMRGITASYCKVAHNILANSQEKTQAACCIVMTPLFEHDVLCAYE